MSQKINSGEPAEQEEKVVQETNGKPVPFRAILPHMPGAIAFFRRYRSHPEALEPYLVSLQGKDFPEKNLPELREALIAWRKAANDKQASHRMDRYLVGGIGAFDIVLFSVILAIGASDRPLSVALFALCISLPLASCSLFISFVKSEYKIPVYGKFHSNLMFLALLTGTIAIAAAIWHMSVVDAIVFSSLVVILFMVSAGYFIFVLLATYYFQGKEATATTNIQATSQDSGVTAPALPDEPTIDAKTPTATKHSPRRVNRQPDHLDTATKSN